MKETSLIKKFKENGAFIPIIGTLKGITLWFIIAGISYLVQLFGWIEMPKAFFYASIFINDKLICSFGKGKAKANLLTFSVELIYILLYVLSAWIVTQILINFNIFEVYMIMRLGACFITFKEK